jgi:hypothetical protein
MTERSRCGKKKVHTPHWWTTLWQGKTHDLWCDGKHYEPTVREGS